MTAADSSETGAEKPGLCCHSSRASLESTEVPRAEQSMSKCSSGPEFRYLCFEISGSVRVTERPKMLSFCIEEIFPAPTILSISERTTQSPGCRCPQVPGSTRVYSHLSILVFPRSERSSTLPRSRTSHVESLGHGYFRDRRHAGSIDASQSQDAPALVQRRRYAVTSAATQSAGKPAWYCQADRQVAFSLLRPPADAYWGSRSNALRSETRA